jgi:hypothetical protein
MLSNSKARFAFSLLVPALMRKLILVATSIALMAGMMALAAPGEAQGAQWCTRTPRGITNCMYSTHEQCRAAMSGRSGTCVRRHH